MPLPYVGRIATAGSTILERKTDADTEAATVVMTTTGVTAILNTAIAGLSVQSYVDSQDTGLAKKTAVTSADTAYINATQRNLASGIAGLDGSGFVLDSALPSGLLVDRVMKSYSLATSGTIYLDTTNFSSDRATQVTSTSNTAFKAASLVISDPGYPWRPLVTGHIMGHSGVFGSGQFGVGNGNFGKVLVMDSAGTKIYGAGIGTSDSRWTSNTPVSPTPIIPFAGPGQVPSDQPLINGGLELDMFVSVFSGAFYNWFGYGLSMSVQVFPAS